MAIKITDPKIRVTMINDKVRMYLLPPLFNAAVRAGASIMRVYKNLDDWKKGFCDLTDDLGGVHRGDSSLFRVGSSIIADFRLGEKVEI